MAGSIPCWRPEAVVAVAPFQAWGSECVGPWFGRVVARHLTQALGRLPGIHVISFDSMMRYAAPAIPVQRIGREVGTRYVVRGLIVGLDGDDLEYRAALVDARTGQRMTKVVRRAPFDACLDMQDSVIPRLLRPLEQAIRIAELEPVVLPTTRHRLALERVDRAIGAILALDEGAFNRAEAWLREATRLDPEFAQAWAWRARWHCLRVGQGWAKHRPEESLLAKTCAERAIEIDPRNALALATLGHINSYLLREYGTAQRYFGRALEAGPSDALALALSSLTMSYVGRATEARKRIERAIELSPRDPMLFAFHNYAIFSSWLVGDYRAAEKHARESLRLNSNYTASIRMLAAVLVARGNFSEAAAVAAEHRQRMPEFRQLSAPFRDAEKNVRLIGQWRAAGILN